MTWCYALNRLMECNSLCVTCKNNPDYWAIPQQYNYKCPDCHGEFNYPSIPATTSSLYYKCPFCGRAMEGLNQDGFKTED